MPNNASVWIDGANEWMTAKGAENLLVDVHSNDVEVGRITFHRIVSNDDFEKRQIQTLKNPIEIIRTRAGGIITGELNNKF